MFRAGATLPPMKRGTEHRKCHPHHICATSAVFEPTCWKVRTVGKLLAFASRSTKRTLFAG
jgi:hypothetical protein